MPRTFTIPLPDPDDTSPEAIAARQVRIMAALESLASGLHEQGRLSESAHDDAVNALQGEDFQIVEYAEGEDDEPGEDEEPADADHPGPTGG